MNDYTLFYVYELYCIELEEDWRSEVPGAIVETKVLRDRVVVNDCSDNICIGGADINGKHRQYDSYEAYYAEGYFNKNPEWKLSIESFKVQVPNIKQFKI